MPNFIFAYHGGHMPEGEDEIAKTMAAWQAWFETMGAAVVDPGNPVGMSKTVTDDSVTDGGGANPISGYTVVTADDIDAAADLAKGCPMVVDGTGSIEVAEIHQM
ncbi:YciI family protein [uncultured Roseobacter sp.]|uniref:YciI family protein n=1 Tax=uncultured Roseobacter sp. TaxID=114847 RepID=UPI002618B610|nr:YciI family protein [uncultured Roseobacter sp.]